MKHHIFRLTIALAILITALCGCQTNGEQGPIRPQAYQETIRVACIGDSITYGAAIEDHQRYNYPRQLGCMLGCRWAVRNFGINGATLLKRGDNPYWKHEAFSQAMAYAPHVVVIKLGTNDTKPQNWQFRDELAADYKDMIARFRALPSRPRIWVCLPVPAYPERWGISDARIRDGVIPAVREVARETGVSLIDLYEALSDKPELFPDQIHPNAEGARLIAEQVYMALTGHEQGPHIPQVLIIGDSISIGYFEPVREMLLNRADVFHNPGNAQHTKYGLARLDAWLGQTKWDVIHFNHGLHDLKYADKDGKLVPVSQGNQQIPIEQYAQNLDELTARLVKTGAKVVFATTTPVPEGSTGRVCGDAERYNNVAVQIMNKYGVQIDDLYSFARVRLDSIQQPRNVHFTDAGSRLLAEQVAESILQALDN